MSEGRIYTIDGGAVVRKTDPPLPTKESLENVSWFFAQLFPKYDEFVSIVLPAYEAIRLWKPDPDRIVRLQEQIARSRDAGKRALLIKHFVIARASLVIQGFRDFLFVSGSPMTTS